VRSGRSTTDRRKQGAIIIEGAVGLMLITGVCVACLTLMMALGTASAYKYKLGCVSDRTAEYMATLVYWSGASNPNFAGPNLQLHAQQLVNNLLNDYGLPPSSTVTANITTSASEQLITVGITVPNLKIIGGAVALPVSVTLSDTAVAAVPVSEPPGVVTFTNGTRTIFVPAFGAQGTAQFYNWTPSPFQADMSVP
jgi:hypothetical protein